MSSSGDFDFFNLLAGALDVEGTGEEDDIEKEVFQPLPCLQTEKDAPSHPPSPRTEHTPHRTKAKLSTQRLVASGLRDRKSVV